MYIIKFSFLEKNSLYFDSFNGFFNDISDSLIRQSIDESSGYYEYLGCLRSGVTSNLLYLNKGANLSRCFGFCNTHFKHDTVAMRQQ